MRKQSETIPNNLTFGEWIAYNEVGTGEEIPFDWAKWTKDIGIYSEVHSGDCTKEPHSCFLCYLEGELENYREYVFRNQSEM